MKHLWSIFTACALLAGGAMAQQYPQNPAPPPASAYPQQSYPAGAPAPAMQVPAGTNLSIRTNEQIVADKDSTGRSYSAEISQDVLGPNGQVLIPRGSPATLTVSEVTSGTMGVGSNQVALALRSINFNGRTYMVEAPTETQQGNNQGIGANKRTAIMTGGGAVLGTILGAAVGGGKGAAIGAILGAGGGAAAQVLTRGSEVKVPAETVLTFKLDQPLTLQ